MAAAPAKRRDLLPEFRAPPPSPVAGGKPEAPDEEEDELAGFLTRSRRVPELVLPDQIFHRAAWDLPVIDMRSLFSPEADGSAVMLLKSSAKSLGCFQLVNHGVPSDLMGGTGAAAAAAFRLSPEKKKEVSRSPERRWGFEVDEDEGEEFFWWCGRRDVDLAGIWPHGFKAFSEKMEQLWVEMEKIAGKIEPILSEDGACDDSGSPDHRRRGVAGSSVLCVQKHGRSKDGGDRPAAGSLKHDVLRMLIRSSACSHALAVHFHGGAAKFHVYSKRGCVPFRVKEGALVLTVGDEIQASSGGHSKHVIGKPVFHDGDDQQAISIQFLYSRPSSGNATTTSSCTSSDEREKTISLARQVLIAVCMILLYHIASYISANI